MLVIEAGYSGTGEPRLLLTSSIVEAPALPIPRRGGGTPGRQVLPGGTLRASPRYMWAGAIDPPSTTCQHSSMERIHSPPRQPSRPLRTGAGVFTFGPQVRPERMRPRSPSAPP
jgi:hypothetical protein